MDAVRGTRTIRREVPKWLPITAAVGLLVLLGIAVWLYARAQPETVAAERRDVVATVEITGRVIVPPAARAQVFPPYRATVQRVQATLNERVRQGDLLVELDIPSADVAVRSAQRALQDAEQALREAEREAEEAVASAQRRLRQLEAGRADAAVEGAPAQQSGARAGTPAPAAGAPAQEPPAPPGTVTGEASAQERQAAEEALRQALRRRDVGLRPYREALDRARDALEAARRGRMQALVRAPVSGVITSLNATEGAVVGVDPRIPLATLVDYDRLQVQATLTPEQAQEVRRGMAVRLRPADAPDQNLDGTVLHVTTSASPSGRVTEYRVAIGFRNRDQLIRPDQQVTGSIVTREARGVVAVPVGAIGKDEQGRPTVEVRRGGRWQTVRVVLGASDGEYTEIRQGIRAGEEVKAPPAPTG